MGGWWVGVEKNEGGDEEERRRISGRERVKALLCANSPTNAGEAEDAR